MEEMALNIYEASKDMDWGDYEDVKDESVKNLVSALEKIRGYADYNEDFSALWQALERIYGEV